MEFVEIYQDDVRDLLRAGDTQGAAQGPIVIRESPLRGTYCENAVYASWSCGVQACWLE